MGEQSALPLARVKNPARLVLESIGRARRLTNGLRTKHDHPGVLMSQPLSNAPGPSRSSSLAKAFARLGWIGFWVQVVVGSVPAMLMIYVFAFAGDTGAGTRGGLPLVEYLTVFSLLVLAFTTLWSYRYTRLANRIADPQRARRSWR
jgi:hypothetical protein